MGTFYYTGLFDAYAKALTGNLIEVQGITFVGDLLLNRGIAVTLKGGYTAGFPTPATGLTTLKGKLTIVNGSLNVDRLVVQ